MSRLLIIGISESILTMTITRFQIDRESAVNCYNNSQVFIDIPLEFDAGAMNKLNVPTAVSRLMMITEIAHYPTDSVTSHRTFSPLEIIN